MVAYAVGTTAVESLEEDTGRKGNPNEYFQSKRVKLHALSYKQSNRATIG